MDLGQAKNTAVIDVVEPKITLTKTGPIAADLGDVVPYTVTLKNTGTGPAYDVLIKDPLAAADLTYKNDIVVQIKRKGDAAFTTVTPGTTAGIGALSGVGTDGFQFKIDMLDREDEVKITYSANLSRLAAPVANYANTVNVTYYSLPDDTAHSRSYTAEQTHRVHAGPTIAKYVSGSSDANTGTGEHSSRQTDALVGETVTYTLTIELPEISMQSVSIEDVLPQGLKFVSAKVGRAGAGVSAGSFTAAADGDALTVTGDPSSASGQKLAFVFNNVTNPLEGGITTADDEFTLEIVALVMPDAVNSDGAERTNTAKLVVTPNGLSTNGNNAAYDATSDSATIDIVEPKLTVDKTGSLATNPGETVTYTVTVQHDAASTGPAYDVQVKDLLGSDQLTLVGSPSFARGTSLNALTTLGASDVTTTALTPDGFSAVVGQLLKGEILQVTYQVKLGDSPSGAASFDNTARIAFDTVRDGSPTSTTARQPTPISDDHSIATIPKLSKDVLSSSRAETGSDQFNSGVTDLNIGEEVTYVITVTVPQIAMSSVVVSDTLPEGLSFVSAKVADVASGITGANSRSFAQVGQGLTFDFGDLTRNGGSGEIKIHVTALVTGDSANVAGRLLTNSADVKITAQDGSDLQKVSDTAQVELVEPVLQLDKTGPRAVNPGEVASYRVVVSHTPASTGVAYDVVIADQLASADLSLISGSVQVLLNGAAQSWPVTQGTDGFSVTAPFLKPGDQIELRYDARLSASAATAHSFDNTASVGYDNIPGTPGDSSLSRSGSSSDGHRVATIPGLSKTAIASDNPDTGSGQHGGFMDLTVGEEVTFELVLTLPEIALGDAVLTDTLPEGLRYTGHSLVSSGTGITGVTPVLTQTGQELRFDFGAMANAYDGSIGPDDEIRLHITAEVLDLDAVRDGAVLTNTARLSITPLGEAALQTQTDSASVEVVEPKLTVEKSVSDPGPMMGDVITYKVVLTNSADATSPAYNVVMRDTLPAALTLTGKVTLSDPSLAQVVQGRSAGETTLVVTAARLLPGQQVIAEFEAFVGWTTPVLTDLSNVATVDATSTPKLDQPGRVEGARVSLAGNSYVSGEAARSVGGADRVSIIVDPVPETPVSSGGRFSDLGIDDEYFLPVIAIDPIYSGSAEPGASVTINLFRADGALTYSRHILADAAGHWIAIFPRVSYQAPQDDFYEFYAGSALFDAPVQLSDTQVADSMGFVSPVETYEMQTQLESQAYYIQMQVDRPLSSLEDPGVFNSRTFYASGQHPGGFVTSDALNVSEVFKQIAATSVNRLYEASDSPLSVGLNRFSYEFLNASTAVSGV